MGNPVVVAIPESSEYGAEAPESPGNGKGNRELPVGIAPRTLYMPWQKIGRLFPSRRCFAYELESAWSMPQTSANKRGRVISKVFAVPVNAALASSSSSSNVSGSIDRGIILPCERKDDIKVTQT